MSVGRDNLSSYLRIASSRLRRDEECNRFAKGGTSILMHLDSGDRLDEVTCQLGTSSNSRIDSLFNDSII